MSTTATPASFTLRDLNRQPAKVLAAVRKFGSAEVRTRTGEIFTVAPKPPVGPSRKREAKEVRDRFQDLWAKQRSLGLIPPDESENERINRIIAGEE